MSGIAAMHKDLWRFLTPIGLEGSSNLPVFLAAEYQQPQITVQELELVLTYFQIQRKDLLSYKEVNVVWPRMSISQILPSKKKWSKSPGRAWGIQETHHLYRARKTILSHTEISSVKVHPSQAWPFIPKRKCIFLETVFRYTRNRELKAELRADIKDTNAIQLCIHSIYYFKYMRTLMWPDISLLQPLYSFNKCP